MFNKLRGEYQKAEMNIFSFLYWTIRADIFDFKQKHGLMKNNNYLSEYWKAAKSR